MTGGFHDGYGGYLVLLAICAVAHEPWRWMGFVLGRNLSVASPIFLWVRAVATALVSGLVMKLVVFPAGTLASVPGSVRLTALVGGLALYRLCGNRLAAGVAGGSVLLAAIEFARAGLGIWN